MKVVVCVSPSNDRRGRIAAPSFSIVSPNLISVVSPTYNGNGIVHTVRRREEWFFPRNKTEVHYEQDHHEVG